MTLEGRLLQPAWAKTQAHIYYRRPLIYTRILWLPLDSAVVLALDGRPVSIRRARESGLRIGERESTGSLATDRTRGSRLGPRDRPGAPVRAPDRAPASHAGRRAAAVVRGRFKDAWVFMDRPNEADDNAERLFEYVREHRPDINAWFAISGDSTDYVRLRSHHSRDASLPVARASSGC